MEADVADSPRFIRHCLPIKASTYAFSWSRWHGGLPLRFFCPIVPGRHIIMAMATIVPTTLTRRIIPCLDVTAGRVVKGTKFAALRDQGDPVELAARYDAAGGDELTLSYITPPPRHRQTKIDGVPAPAPPGFLPPTAACGV